jgi:phosphohistidine phosphatase SixA
MLLIRHAQAGDREQWEGDDRERPLDARGERQAVALVDQLAGFAIERILSSPYRRCLETVAPLARARGLEVEAQPELGEEHQLTEGVGLVRSLAGEAVAVCGHRGLDASVSGAPRWKKGSTFVVAAGPRLVEALPPPA